MLHSVFKHGSRSAWQTTQHRLCRFHTTHGHNGSKERKPDGSSTRLPHFSTSFDMFSKLAQWNHPIYASERISDHRSIFLAHVSTLLTPSALPTFIRHLTSLQALKRATHCMYAYRVVKIRPDISRTLHVGQHDGGEKGSGERLSRLLQALQCENVVVVVSRRYGGVKLGSDRWKLISMVAKDALRRAAATAIVKEKAPETPKSHGSHSRKRK